ncbi:MAG TPA: sensor domain-containing diguanylate cyclase, partial [Fibrobacteraceae bacterium]|nr:sensor domain-containing diguanylate cyclase [Fibrobacteraceae bacterium]
MKRRIWLFWVLPVVLFVCFVALAWAKDGWVFYLRALLLVASGSAVGVLITLMLMPRRPKPMTERLTRRNLQEDLRTSEERLKLVIDGTNDGIWDWDIASDKVFWSERAHLLAANGSLGLGDSWEVLRQKLYPGDREKLDAAIRGHIVGDVPFNIELRIQMLDGKPKHLQIRGKAKRDENGKPVRMAGSISDVTQRKTAEQELIYNAYHDSLTAVGNRKMFTDRLEHHIQRASKRRDYLFAILILDVDHFRMINDSYGHTVGDRVLRELAMRLEDRCRPFEDQLVARIGGDVFGVAIGNIQQTRQIQDLTLCIEQDLMTPMVVEKLEIAVSATIGIVFNGDKLEPSEEMLANADTVL